MPALPVAETELYQLYRTLPAELSHEDKLNKRELIYNDVLARYNTVHRENKVGGDFLQVGTVWRACTTDIRLFPFTLERADYCFACGHCEPTNIPPVRHQTFMPLDIPEAAREKWTMEQLLRATFGSRAAQAHEQHHGCARTDMSTDGQARARVAFARSIYIFQDSLPQTLVVAPRDSYSSIRAATVYEMKIPCIVKMRTPQPERYTEVMARLRWMGGIYRRGTDYRVYVPNAIFPRGQDDPAPPHGLCELLNLYDPTLHGGFEVKGLPPCHQEYAVPDAWTPELLFYRVADPSAEARRHLKQACAQIENDRDPGLRDRQMSDAREEYRHELRRASAHACLWRESQLRRAERQAESRETRPSTTDQPGSGETARQPEPGITAPQPAPVEPARQPEQANQPTSKPVEPPKTGKRPAAKAPDERPPSGSPQPGDKRKRPADETAPSGSEPKRARSKSPPPATGIRPSTGGFAGYRARPPSGSSSDSMDRHAADILLRSTAPGQSGNPHTPAEQIRRPRPEEPSPYSPLNPDLRGLARALTYASTDPARVPPGAPAATRPPAPRLPEGPIPIPGVTHQLWPARPGELPPPIVAPSGPLPPPIDLNRPNPLLPAFNPEEPREEPPEEKREKPPEEPPVEPESPPAKRVKREPSSGPEMEVRYREVISGGVVYEVEERVPRESSREPKVEREPEPEPDLPDYEDMVPRESSREPNVERGPEPEPDLPDYEDMVPRESSHEPRVEREPEPLPGFSDYEEI